MEDRQTILANLDITTQKCFFEYINKLENTTDILDIHILVQKYYEKFPKELCKNMMAYHKYLKSVDDSLDDLLYETNTIIHNDSIKTPEPGWNEYVTKYDSVIKEFIEIYIQK